MQSTNHILMIRPVAFTFNTQTATSNSFQKANNTLNTQQNALNEFDAFVNKLTEAGVKVHVIEDTLEPHTPDSIFPNNWISFHENNWIGVYPMQAENRRTERRADILETLSKDFLLEEIVDYTDSEKEDKFLEGTGSMVLDRDHQICYACISPRTHIDLLQQFCAAFNYQLVHFVALDADKKPIYHTNVVMSVTTDFLIVCWECIPSETERNKIKQSTTKQIIEINLAQLNQFAGNVLEVLGAENKKYLVMSEQAYKALTPSQIEMIESLCSILYTPLYTIENNGGGSARCMMAEIFLKERTAKEKA
ncbi:MAG: arginine deiminase-related protein [Bacteroidota bacterium]